jgi:hypothetical protein
VEHEFKAGQETFIITTYPHVATRRHAPPQAMPRTPTLPALTDMGTQDDNDRETAAAAARRALSGASWDAHGGHKQPNMPPPPALSEHLPPHLRQPTHHPSSPSQEVAPAIAPLVSLSANVVAQQVVGAATVTTTEEVPALVNASSEPVAATALAETVPLSPNTTATAEVVMPAAVDVAMAEQEVAPSPPRTAGTSPAPTPNGALPEETTADADAAANDIGAGDTEGMRWNASRRPYAKAVSGQPRGLMTKLQTSATAVYDFITSSYTGLHQRPSCTPGSVPHRGRDLHQLASGSGIAKARSARSSSRNRAESAPSSPPSCPAQRGGRRNRQKVSSPRATTATTATAKAIAAAAQSDADREIRQRLADARRAAVAADTEEERRSPREHARLARVVREEHQAQAAARTAEKVAAAKAAAEAAAKAEGQTPTPLAVHCAAL